VAKFRGTFASPQAPLSGDSLGKFELAGYGTTSSSGYPQASYEGVATENWGATARGAKVLFYVTPNTTITQAVALTIDQDKSATFASSVTATSFSGSGSSLTGVVTSVTGTSPVVSSGGTTPAISMPAATTSVSGYLTSTDWNTFNNKGSGTVTSVSGTAPVVSSGGATPAISMAAATSSVNGYLTSTDWTTFNNKGSGTVTSVAALTLGTTGTDLSSTVANGTTTPVITLNVPTASATNRGALSAADWSTFNGKAPALTYTANYIPYGQGTTTPTQSSALQFNGTTLTVANRGISTSSVPVGSVIQVVNAVYTTQTGNSTNVLADSGLTATITPLYSTSKILVIVDQNGCYNAGVAQGMQITLLRGASTLANLGIRAGGDSVTGVTMSIGSVSGNYLDSPATTSATTYKTQFSSLGNVAAVYVQVYSSASTITLMEIAA
jgi:hypothetical protein